MSAALASVRLAEVVRVARERGASDVHLCPGMTPAMRVDGILQTQETVALSEDELGEIVRVALSAEDQRRFTAAGDVTALLREAGQGTMRLHVYRAQAGTAVAIRLFPGRIPPLESLRLPAAFCSFANRSHGIVLVTGPTGSGKSTAVAALLDRINRTQAKHILTIEDPIEYVHASERSLVTQRQVPRDVPTFSQAIHEALRSDPDVILVGELREPAAMLAALTAAETGHLVFATLHTGDAPQTIDRVVGAFRADAQEQIRVQLAQTLIGVACLRLIPAAAGAGRVCATELLVATDAVRSLIRDGKTHQLRNVISAGRQFGMQTLETHISELIARREITLEAAKQVTERAAELRNAFQGVS